ncbi:MAG TPA: N-6 DNA methylase [Thermoanaerobaculia bacterium]|nr:N-6 DNA methylase [Thermoanaerobaculia bacterium]
MLTAEGVRALRGEDGALALLRVLGYPAELIDVAPDEWRRAGVVIPWNGEARLRLATRLRRLDIFLLAGNVAEESIATFLRTYRQHNQLTKSVIMFLHDIREDISFYDLSAAGALRRFDVDLTNPSAHAVDRLNLLACTDDETSLPRIVDRALDRETVTRQFFLRFRSAVHDVADALAECCPGEERDEIDGEALLILSRLLFLSFVQVKGWLNGERRFLVDRLDRAMRQRREFFATVLMPLFFGVLNTPLRERTAAARRLGRIPYLNGGLFEPSAFELRHANAMTLPNDLMRRVLDDVFEKFDFSIDEHDSATTHVDPEMLGKVFESLMAGDERARSGSFYTPKPIVDVLTERAITEWLGDGGIEKLESIAILDPACGSGAFLLSALGVIERLYRKLSGGNVPRDLRRRIVERSLFGVDLEPEAVRLCELRLWLAIVSGSDAEIEHVEPLPNLDRNILQGNSLLSPTDFLGDARADLYRDWLHALHAQRDLIDRYRSAARAERPALARLIRENDRRLAADLLHRAIEAAEHELQSAITPQTDLFGRVVPRDLERCRALQERIAEHRRALERIDDGTLDFFSFDVHFAHVRFDVVASNPPWVRNSRIDPRAKRMYSDRYAFFRSGGGAAFHQPDLSIAFFERATSLVAEDGVLAMLMPAKIANAAYASTLRRAVQERMSLIELVDWSDEPHRWFDADTFPMGIVVRPRKTSAPACDVQLIEDAWALVPPDVAAILRRIREAYPPLEEALGRKPLMGVKTGDNRAFFLDAKRLTRGHLITTDGIAVPLTAVCRCVRGRDVRRWHADASQWMLWPPAGGWRDAPKWLTQLAGARGVDADSLQLAFVRAEHVGIKVVWKDLSRGMAAAVLPDVVHVDAQAFPLVPNQTLYSLDAATLDEAYALAALFNSTVADALLLCVVERAKDAHFRYFGRTVALMPMPVLDHERLCRLSRRAHHGASVQNEVDCIVASLYGVTSDELEVLRTFVARRLGAR